MPEVLANESRENKRHPSADNAAGWRLYSRGVITHTHTLTHSVLTNGGRSSALRGERTLGRGSMTIDTKLTVFTCTQKPRDQVKTAN